MSGSLEKELKNEIKKEVCKEAGKEVNKEAKLLQWHPAFFAAFRLETKRKEPRMRLQNEYPLGTKPMVIDILALKDKKKSALQGDVLGIFRKYNIVEYKNPAESLSVNDYYKVMSYACSYIANAKYVMDVEPWEVTVTFVCNRYPREMLKHLEKEYGVKTERKGQGIYWLVGNWFPVQIIITHELDPKRNLWMYSLRGDLTREEIEEVVRDYKYHMHEKDYQSVMELIVRANWKKMEEEKKMCDALRELFAEEFEERERIGEERGEKRGEERGEKRGEKIGERNKVISLIQKKLAKGKTEEVIAEELEEEVSVIREMIAQMAN